jgi:hypothetical protein
MRQGQQNRRGRGRNRKAHHNPLTRSFESNGPDVKIRGTPSHIAEKYMSLARDAQSAGDHVLAENYLQHAEHYNRIIMAFREQTLQQSGEAMNGSFGRHRDGGDAEEIGEDDGEEAEGFPPQVRGHEPQPRGDGPVRFEERSQRFPEERLQRQPHEQGRPMRERYHEPRGGYSGERQPAPSMQPQPQQQVSEPLVSEPVQQPRSEAPVRRRERFATPSHEQPEFLRRPVRRPRREAAGSEASDANGASVKDDTDTDKTSA